MTDVGHNSAGQLRSLVERCARLEDQKAEIAQDIKDVKTEAKSAGFDVKVLSQMVKEFRANADETAAMREFVEMCELYRAALGMLGDTPLGDAARKRAARPPDQPRAPAHDPETGEIIDAPAATADAEPEEAVEPEFPPEDLEQARQRGRDDAAAGKRIFDNPYLADDPRRARWDEGYCQQTGGDGMEIPPHLRRRQKPEGNKDKKDVAE